MNSPESTASSPDIGPDFQTPETSFNRLFSKWMIPIEAACAALMVSIVVMLFSGVMARYVFSRPLGWVDEAVSFAFIWVAYFLRFFTYKSLGILSYFICIGFESENYTFQAKLHDFIDFFIDRK
jgi:hypothetical protein